MKALASIVNGTGVPVRLGLLALGLALAAATAQPAAAADDGWYGGLSAGQTRADVDDERIIARLIDDGFSTATLTEFEDDIGYKLFLGYQLNRNLAIEGGYYHLGEFGYMAEMDPVATMRGSTRLMGLNLDLVGMLPLSERFSAFGRVGVVYNQARDQFSGGGPIVIDPFQTREREASYKFGAGIQYDISEKLGLRLEAERYRVDDAIGSDGDIDLFSLGVVYRFGRTTPVAAAPAPAVVQAAPARAPAAAPAPAPAPEPAPMRVTLSADALFDFNSSTVRPAGRAELDKLANDLRGVDFDNIEVTGHTDRIGSPAYNRRLAMERAEAVKAHLVQVGGISAVKVSTRGVNGNEPVTTQVQCPDTMARQQLITCLAPDRRVDVEVRGTRPR